MRYFILLLSVFLTAPAWAITDPNLENLGTFDDWTAYVHHDDEGRICYIASQPTKSSGKYAKRDDVFLMITHRPQEKAFNVMTIVAGYTYQKGSVPTISVDNKKAVALVSHEDSAWAKDAKTDKQLAEQLKAGNQAVVKGKSKRGTLTTDTFSLKGFSKAYNKISEACSYQ